MKRKTPINIIVETSGADFTGEIPVKVAMESFGADLTGEFPVTVLVMAKKADLTGEIPVSFFKKGKFDSFGGANRKNSGYFHENKADHRFNRNFSA